MACAGVRKSVRVTASVPGIEPLVVGVRIGLLHVDVATERGLAVDEGEQFHRDGDIAVDVEGAALILAVYLRRAEAGKPGGKQFGVVVDVAALEGEAFGDEDDVLSGAGVDGSTACRMVRRGFVGSAQSLPASFPLMEETYRTVAGVFSSLTSLWDLRRRTTKKHNINKEGQEGVSDRVTGRSRRKGEAGVPELPPVSSTECRIHRTV